MIRLNRYRKLLYKGKMLDVKVSKYSCNGRLALQATEHKTGEPFAVLTINIPAYDKNFNQADMIFLDTNNVPDIYQVLWEHGYISEVIGRVQSGYCTYPVVRWLG